MSETITIEKLVYGGDALARVDGRVVLAPLLLPGETAEVERVDKLHSRLLRVIQPAPERIAPGCEYFGTCGGCHYQHAPYGYQLEQKVAILREVVRRVGKFDAPAHIETISGPEWNYRNRVQLHFAGGQVGYLRMGSHELCAITHCPISSAKINEVIAIFVRMARDRRFPSFVRSIEVFTNEIDVQINVVDTERPLAKRFFDWCAEEIPGYANGAVEYGGFRVGPRSFFQVNRFLVDALVTAGIGDAAGATALDLYAGVGLFSVPLAERFERVTAVEGSSAAVADLKANAARAGAKVEAHTQPVDDYLRGIERAPEFILADPPRSGLGKLATRELARLRAPRLHLVGCDPATLARDAAPLLAAGYRLERMALVDLFPQTYHFETVIALRSS